VHWDEFAEHQPRLAGLGKDRLEAPRVVLVGTIRRDGTPRLSPVEPLFWGRDLWLSMLWGSRKARECKIRGRVVPEHDPIVQASYAAEVLSRLGWGPEPGRFHLFWVDVEDVTFIRYDDATGDQYMARWPAGIESVRRGTSATSVGEPEPYADLLVGLPTD
jgi:hypothetical protein